MSNLGQMCAKVCETDVFDICTWWDWTSPRQHFHCHSVISIMQNKFTLTKVKPRFCFLYLYYYKMAVYCCCFLYRFMTLCFSDPQGSELSPKNVWTAQQRFLASILWLRRHPTKIQCVLPNHLVAHRLIQNEVKNKKNYMNLLAVD